jgi:hypothetical protein
VPETGGETERKKKNNDADNIKMKEKKNNDGNE